MWTIDELVERVREALAAEYSGATDGRVRDVPDRRAIRWYTTIGLVDRPLGMRGRTALYGPHHLQQLVAIKRLQAAGRSLSDIQGEFSRLTDVVLAEVAHVPESLLEADGPEPDQASDARHMRFWAQVGRTTDLDSALPEQVLSGSGQSEHTLLEHTLSEHTLLEPALPKSALPRPASSQPPLVPHISSPVAAGSAFGAATHGPATAGSAISGVTLGGGAMLLVPNGLSDDDRAAILAAAAPLLDLLRSRGLIDGRSA